MEPLTDTLLFHRYLSPLPGALWRADTVGCICGEEEEAETLALWALVLFPLALLCSGMKRGLLNARQFGVCDYSM